MSLRRSLPGSATHCLLPVNRQYRGACLMRRPLRHLPNGNTLSVARPACGPLISPRSRPDSRKNPPRGKKSCTWLSDSKVVAYSSPSCTVFLLSWPHDHTLSTLVNTESRRLSAPRPGSGQQPLDVDARAFAGNLRVVQCIHAEARKQTTIFKVKIRQCRIADFDPGIADTAKRAKTQFTPSTELATDVEDRIQPLKHGTDP